MEDSVGDVDAGAGSIQARAGRKLPALFMSGPFPDPGFFRPDLGRIQGVPKANTLKMSDDSFWHEIDIYPIS